MSPGIFWPIEIAEAAIAHLVRQLALELARYRITVNAIQPGPFETRITTPELLPIFEQSSPSHRIGRPEEIEGIALLCLGCLGLRHRGAVQPRRRPIARPRRLTRRRRFRALPAMCR